MTVSVRYYCPRCGTVATLQRGAYLDDKSVTPYPLEGWTYADPEDDFENAYGVRLRCGEHGENGMDTTEEPCGERFYLNFIRFEGGEEVETVPESEHVRLGVGPRADGPRVPDVSDGSHDNAGGS